VRTIMYDSIRNIDVSRHKVKTHKFRRTISVFLPAYSAVEGSAHPDYTLRVKLYKSQGR